MFTNKWTLVVKMKNLTYQQELLDENVKVQHLLQQLQQNERMYIFLESYDIYIGKEGVST